MCGDEVMKCKDGRSGGVHVSPMCEGAALTIGMWVILYHYLGTLAVNILGC